MQKREGLKWALGFCLDTWENHQCHQLQEKRRVEWEGIMEQPREMFENDHYIGRTLEWLCGSWIPEALRTDELWIGV